MKRWEVSFYFWARKKFENVSSSSELTSHVSAKNYILSEEWKVQADKVEWVAEHLQPCSVYRHSSHGENSSESWCSLWEGEQKKFVIIKPCNALGSHSKLTIFSSSEHGLEEEEKWEVKHKDVIQWVKNSSFAFWKMMKNSHTKF